MPFFLVLASSSKITTMAFLLVYLWAIITFLVHPVLGNLPPDNDTFILLNRDLDEDQALSFNVEANPLYKGIYMRSILQGPQNTDLWYFDHAHLGNNDFSTTNPDNPNPLVWAYGTDRIVIGHVADKTLDNSSMPATWLFERQDDGTWTIRTYDQRFLGLDLGDKRVPMLYPVSPGGQGGFANWELVSVPTVEGDVIEWTTVSRTVDAVTSFLVGRQQGTRVVTVVVTSTRVNSSRRCEK